MSTAILRTIVSETLTSQKCNERWSAYKALREKNTEIAATTWRDLINSSEKVNFLSQLDQSVPESAPVHGFKGLTAKNLWGKNAPPYFEIKVLLSMAGLSSNKDAITLLSSQHPVNYHGYFCAHLKDACGKVPKWDEAEGAFHVEERSKVAIMAFIQSTSAGLPATMQRVEMEVAGGASRPVVPFQVEVEGYPLRFLERSKYEKLQVPAEGKSELMRFPIHPESLIANSDGSNRVAVWINCRQNNTLVQCVCVPLLVVARKKQGRAAVKKAKSKQ